jgi:hypothetical protein
MVTARCSQPDRVERGSVFGRVKGGVAGVDFCARIRLSVPQIPGRVRA